jgi:hypothetical protein
VPCWIDSPSFGIIDGKILSTSTGEIFVHSQDNEETRKIEINDRFLKFGQAFKIVGIDRYSKPGMIILICEKDVINESTDDVEKDLAGGKSCSITITNIKPIQIQIGQTIQIEYNTVGDPPVVYSSSDESIATVDENGIVTGISAGITTITVANATMPSLFDSVDVIISEAQNSYTINIKSSASNPDEIKLGQSKTYQAEVLLNDTLVTDQPVIWELFADDQVSPTTLATITSQDGQSCTIKNNNANSGFVQLKATLQSDSNVFAWKRIQMKPLY